MPSPLVSTQAPAMSLGLQCQAPALPRERIRCGREAPPNVYPPWLTGSSEVANVSADCWQAPGKSKARRRYSSQPAGVLAGAMRRPAACSGSPQVNHGLDLAAYRARRAAASPMADVPSGGALFRSIHLRPVRVSLRTCCQRPHRLGKRYEWVAQRRWGGLVPASLTPQNSVGQVPAHSARPPTSAHRAAEAVMGSRAC